MISLLKKYEILALNYSRKFKEWDARCVVKDAYLAAYRQALIDHNLPIPQEKDSFDVGNYQLVSDTLVIKK